MVKVQDEIPQNSSTSRLKADKAYEDPRQSSHDAGDNRQCSDDCEVKQVGVSSDDGAESITNNADEYSPQNANDAGDFNDEAESFEKDKSWRDGKHLPTRSKKVRRPRRSGNEYLKKHHTSRPSRSRTPEVREELRAKFPPAKKKSIKERLGPVSDTEKPTFKNEHWNGKSKPGKNERNGSGRNDQRSNSKDRKRDRDRDS